MTNPKHNKQRAQRSILYISAIAAILTCILFYGQKDTYYTYREWKTLQELYHNQEYEQAASRYAGLFVQLYHRTDFLYEGAECFYKTGQHDIAIKWLDRALKLSAAPNYTMQLQKRKGDQAIPESGKLPAGNQQDFTGTGIYLLPTRQIVYKPLFFTSGQIP